LSVAASTRRPERRFAPSALACDLLIARLDHAMRAPSVRWIVDRNPFYLLSACCGLLGCWLLGDVSRPDLLDTAMKTAALLVYETAVVALAVWLSRKDAAVRDGAILSVLTVALAADAAFFSTETAMLKPAAAAGFAALGAAQALAIVGALFKGIPVRVSTRAGWMLGVDIVVVHLLPVMLRFGAEGYDYPELIFWPAFVAMGALLAAHAWPDRWHTGAAQKASRTTPSFSPRLASIAPAVFLASIAAHTFAGAWVFHADFHPVFSVRRWWGWRSSPCAADRAAAHMCCRSPPFSSPSFRRHRGSCWCSGNRTGWRSVRCGSC